ncbi:MAG: hypothetical protein WCY89_09630 [Flavobacteriaceae bacterium]
MKKTNQLLFLLCIGVFFIGCSSDDNSDNNDDNPNPSQLGYFPQNVGDYWEYDVQGEGISGEDHLYVSGETTENGTTYKTFATEQAPTGFYSAILSTGKLSSDNSKSLYTGTINIGEMLGGIEGLSFDITDFVMLDTNASQGNLLSEESGTYYQDLGEYGLDVEYALSSVSQGSLPTFTSEDGTTYDDVKVTTLAFSLKIDFIITFLGVQIPYTVLDTQQVVASTQYYANNIGMIFAETHIEYQLEEIPDLGIEISIPENFQSTQKEILTDFSVGNTE